MSAAHEFVVSNVSSGWRNNTDDDLFTSTSFPAMAEGDVCNDAMPNQTYSFSYAESMSAGVFAAAFAVAGAGLNLLTILALLYDRRTRSHVTTPFIISLSASDFIFSSVTLSVLATKFIKR
jgi:hypothetical protein